MFLKNDILKNFANFKGKHLCRKLFLINCRTQNCNFVKKEAPTKVFTVNFMNFLRTSFLWNTSGGLLLLVVRNTVRIHILSAIKLSMNVFGFHLLKDISKYP